jgi:hypothetical protein
MLSSFEPQEAQAMKEESVTHHSPPAAKIALFRALFRGRDDVYLWRVSGRLAGARQRGQKAAAEAMAVHDIGVLSATTAFGKTVIAAWLIAQRRVNTLVLVHRRQLLEQWVERLSLFLDLRHLQGFPEKTDVSFDISCRRRPHHGHQPRIMKRSRQQPKTRLLQRANPDSTVLGSDAMLYLPKR